MSLDDLIIKALLEPKALLEQTTLADVERLLRQDASTVTWAFSKSLQGVQNAA